MGVWSFTWPVHGSYMIIALSATWVVHGKAGRRKEPETWCHGLAALLHPFVTTPTTHTHTHTHTHTLVHFRNGNHHPPNSFGDHPWLFPFPCRFFHSSVFNLVSNLWTLPAHYISNSFTFHLCGHLHGEGNGTPLQYFCLENPMDGGTWWAAVRGVARRQTRLSDFTFTFYIHALEKEMATHSSVLAWRIPGTAEPGGLPSLGSHRVRHDWSDLAAAATSVVNSVPIRTLQESLTRSFHRCFASCNPSPCSYRSRSLKPIIRLHHLLCPHLKPVLAFHCIELVISTTHKIPWGPMWPGQEHLSNLIFHCSSLCLQLLKTTLFPPKTLLPSVQLHFFL